MLNNKSEILRLHELFKDSQALNDYYSSLKQKIIFNKQHYNSIINSVDFALSTYDENNLLSNIPYALKDNISTKGLITTGGSALLSHYVPVYDATVYANIKKTNAVLVAKDALDEFGLGGTGLYCAYGKVKNPYDENLISGGSSSGSNVNVCTDLVAFSICTDTGDSIRHPASFLNNVGYKPSYGLISRYGVYPFSPSLDTVGISAKYVSDIAIVLSAIASKDFKDFTSITQDNYAFYANLKPVDLKQVKFVYIKNSIQYMETKAQKAWNTYYDWLKQHIHVNEIDFQQELINVLLPTYIAISFAESTTSLANLTGMTFGNKVLGVDFKDSVKKTRTKYLGTQVKQRFLLGSYVLNSSNYEYVFFKAKKVRNIIKQKIDELFKQYDCLILPGAGSFALSEQELMQKGMNMQDDMLLLANFCGIPSITVPAIKQNPYFMGINLNATNFNDQALLNIALSIETLNEQYQGGKDHE